MLTILMYLFSCTLPCDIHSSYLTFCDHLVYTEYLGSPRLFGLSALEDQQCAGALMWTSITLLFLIPAAQITLRLLDPNREVRRFGKVVMGEVSPESSKTLLGN